MEQVEHHSRRTAYRYLSGGANQADAAEDAGPTVLYIHGSGGDHRVWTHQYAPTGPFHPAAALDLSGHGESEDVETAAGPETLTAYAEDVAAVAKVVEADILVGHSMGGAVVFEVLLESHYSPEAAVFADTGAKLAVHESIRTMLEQDFESLVSALHQDSTLLLHEGDEEVADASREALLSAGQAVTLRDFMTCHTFDVRDRIDALDLPALAVVGEHDGMTPPSFHEYLAEEMPNCEFAVVEDAAHLAMLEQPAAFNATLETIEARL